MPNLTLYHHLGTLPPAPTTFHLNNHEKKKSLATNQSAKAHYINSRNWIKTLIQHHGFDPHAYHYLPSGKPIIEHCHQFISITHQQDFWVVALADEPIGIDYQETLPSDPERFAKYFGIATKDILFDWMQREAYAKLTNTSIYRTRTYSTASLLKASCITAYMTTVDNKSIAVVSPCKSLQIASQKLSLTF